MKLFDFGESESRSWFRQILEFSRKRVSFEDNIDCVLVTATVDTVETQIGHSLGRAPKFIIEVASYPNGTAGISWTKAPEADKIFIKRATAGSCTLLLA
jgi:hypothetical protein